MKAQIIFGSESDKEIYLALEKKLTNAGLKANVKILSAHRNPKELKDCLLELPPQVIIAGAGLAAHLPGVVASLHQSPVFGIPVAAQFGGLDAFLSIAQMPKGVPVACTFQHEQLCAFLQKTSFEESICSLQTDESNADHSAANILIANLEQHADIEFNGIRVLYLSEEDKKDPMVALKWFSIARDKGIWVGANRIENAKLFLQKMRGIYGY